MGAGDGQEAWLICRFCERPAYRSSPIPGSGCGFVRQGGRGGLIPAHCDFAFLKE